MVPSLGTELSNEPALFEEVWSWGTEVLKLDKPANGVAAAPLPVESGADIVDGGCRMTVALRRSWAKDLDAATLYELLKLRVEVFVVEQATPYPELDGRDLFAETRHFWLEGPDGEVICTLRLMEEHPGGAEGVPHRPGVHQTQRPRSRPHQPADCRRRWPRWATTRAASTRRPTWRRCTAITGSSATATNSSTTASRTCRW